MSAAKYLLFMFEPHEAAGGIGDLVLNLSTMEACMRRAESEPDNRHKVAEIVEVPSLNVVKRGEWTYEPSPVVGQPITWSYRWEQADTPAPPPLGDLHPEAVRSGHSVPVHVNDDFFTMQVNLSGGSVYVDREPAMIWHVPLATSQPAPNERKGQIVASLLAQDAADYAGVSRETLARKLADRRGWKE